MNIQTAKTKYQHLQKSDEKSRRTFFKENNILFQELEMSVWLRCQSIAFSDISVGRDKF